MKFIGKMATMGERFIIIVPKEDRGKASALKGKHIKVEVEEILL